MNKGFLKFIVQLGLTAILTPIIRLGSEIVAPNPMKWWFCAVIAFVLVFGGWVLFIDDGDVFE